MAMDEPPMPTLDYEPIVELKKIRDQGELLSEHPDVIDPGPASTINELNDQVHMAKEMGCDSIEATEKIVRYFCKSHYPDDVGYFIYHNIKVYIAGHFGAASKRDKISVEQRLFGDSRIVGQPIMTMDVKK